MRFLSGASVDLEGFHCDSRFHFTHRGCRCRLGEVGYDVLVLISRRLHYVHADFGRISLRTRSLFASSVVMVELDGEITQALVMHILLHTLLRFYFS